MPGMLDSILNLGLNAASVQGLTRQTGDERFALDSYRRFVSMYARVVLGIQVIHSIPPFPRRWRHRRRPIHRTSPSGSWSMHSCNRLLL